MSKKQRKFADDGWAIWIDGDEDRAAVVADAIKMIEEKAQARDLTEKVKVYLESKLPAEEE